MDDKPSQSLLYNLMKPDTPRVVLMAVIGLLLFLLLAALIVLLLWNYVMVSVFKLPAINLWQSLALVILAKILLC